MTLVCKSGNYTRERGMDIRFYSLLAGLGLPNIYHDLGVFYKNVGILLGGVSDCEELVGVTHRR